MPAQFDPWVRVVCGTAFGLAAYALYDPAAQWRGLVLAVLAVAFVLWPERIAFAYRHGKGRPRWSTARSIVDPDRPGFAEAAERFDTYLPRVAHLFNGYVSVGGYLLPFMRFGPDPTAGVTAVAAIVSCGLILWLASRQEAF